MMAQETSAENMDLSLFAVLGGQSHFRGENVNSLVTSFPPRKSGQSPVNGYEARSQIEDPRPKTEPVRGHRRCLRLFLPF